MVIEWTQVCYRSQYGGEIEIREAREGGLGNVVAEILPLRSGDYCVTTKRRSKIVKSVVAAKTWARWALENLR